MFDRQAAHAALDVVTFEITNVELRNAVKVADLDLLVQRQLPGGRCGLAQGRSIAAGTSSAPPDVNEAFASLREHGGRFARPAEKIVWRNTDSEYWIG